MNWLDIVLIVVFVLATLFGLWRGIIMTALPLVGIIVGVILAGQHYVTVGGWLGDFQYAEWTAYALIVFAVFIVSVIVAIILRKFIRLTFLGWIDHVGGAVFGLAAGGLLCAAALAACVKFDLGADIIQGSGVARLLLDWFPVVLGLLPEEFDAVKDFFE